MKYDFYDPKFITEEGIRLKNYPETIDDKLAVVAVIAKEGLVSAVDVSNPANNNVFIEGCCRVPHGVSVGKISYYAINRELLATRGASDRAISINEADLPVGLGRGAA